MIRVARQIVSLMRGKIGVVSAKESELELVFQVPFSKQPVVEAPAVTTPAVVEAVAPESLHEWRVLVADPFGRCVGLVVPVLELMGCEATRVRSGEEILEELHRAAREGEPYRCAILDAVLPDRSLDSICEGIRAQSEWRLDLIMTTSMGQPGDAEWASRLGFRAYLPMPVEAEDLQDALREIARGVPTATASGTLPLITRHSLAEQRLKARDGAPTAETAGATDSWTSDGDGIAPGLRDWSPRPARSANEWEDFFGEVREAA